MTYPAYLPKEKHGGSQNGESGAPAGSWLVLSEFLPILAPEVFVCVMRWARPDLPVGSQGCQNKNERETGSPAAESDRLGSWGGGGVPTY